MPIPGPPMQPLRGDRLSASALKRQSETVAGVHEELRRGRYGGAAVALSQFRPESLVPGVITAVYATDGLMGAFWPSHVRYQAQVRGGGAGSKVGVEGIGVFPEYGRPVRGDECRIYPASVDMECWVLRCVRGPEDDEGGGQRFGLLVLLEGSEKVARRRCGG